MDFIAGALELLAGWVIGNRRKVGFLIAIFGSTIWIIHALYNKTSYGLLIVCIPAVIINSRNYIKWSMCERKKNG